MFPSYFLIIPYLNMSKAYTKDKIKPFASNSYSLFHADKLSNRF